MAINVHAVNLSHSVQGPQFHLPIRTANPTPKQVEERKSLDSAIQELHQHSKLK